jgi:cytochrome P450
MSEKPDSHDWDPRSENVLQDQIAAYDDMRHRCPVAHSEYLHWSLFRHADVVRALNDHETFSNVVSSHLSVPNGMDPPQHTGYRRLIEPYFNPQRMAVFEPVCREIAANLVKSLPAHGETELMSALAQDFALQIQSAYLGWPVAMHEPLRQWTRKNQAATLARDRGAMSAVALEFDGYIRDLLAVRRAAGPDGCDDMTAGLLRERIGERLLTDDEIVSILRNWTVGELATIAASVGILAQYLAERPELQQQLRQQKALLPAAIDEILRIHAPLIAARRRTTRPVEIGGRTLPEGEQVYLMWASANRDEAVFGDPDEFRLDRDPAQNLLYGVGIHVCPGAPLARLELQLILEELLAQTSRIAPVPGKQPVNAQYPTGGFSTLPLWIERTQ